MSRAFRNKGFTLIEVVVSVTLMAVALSMIGVIFLSSFVAQRKMIAFEQTMSNARVLLDTLSREIRTSKICGNTGGVRTCEDVSNNTLPGDISTRLDIIRNSDGRAISYCIFENPPGAGTFAALGRAENDELFSVNPCGTGASFPGVEILHSPEVAVLATTTPSGAHKLSGFITEGVGQTPYLTGDCVNLTGTPKLDTCQPRVTVMLHMQSLTQKSTKEKVEAQFQTTISQRMIDIP